MAFTSDNIKVFLAVLDCGSFSAAARHLKRVPSAVSMTIANLEAELDVVLFDRSSREPVPTEEATALEAKARQIISHLDQLNIHALEIHKGLEKQIAIAVVPELLSTQWSKPLAILAQEYPMLEVDVFSAPQEKALDMLHSGQVQLAFVFERVTLDDREEFQEFAKETVVGVISPAHKLYKQKGNLIRVEDLREVRQIAIANRQLAYADQRFIMSRSVWHTDNHLATLSLVQAGLGWALLPKALVEPLINAGLLVNISFENISNQFTSWVDLVWSKKHPLGLGAKRYIELIKAQYVDLQSPSK